MNLTQDFAADFDSITTTLMPDYAGRPTAFSRFGDGEYAIIQCMAHCAKSDGWHWGGQNHILRYFLANSLTAGSELADYYVGISAANHHPKAHAWYMRELTTYDVPMNRVTFASLFIFSNYERFLSAIKSAGGLESFVTIGCTTKHDFRVPRDPRDASWPGVVDELAAELLNIDHCQAILVSAGPWGKVLVHRYWQLTDHNRDRRQTIIDVGSAVDELFRGRRTRRYHDPVHPQRNWIPRMEIRQNAESPS